MGCSEGSCTCGKGNKSPVQEHLALVQVSTDQGMLSTGEWMKGLGSLTVKEEVLVIRFKNNRKIFYRNPRGISLQKDDRVVVEAEGGHDLGTVSLTGDQVDKQFEQKSDGDSKSYLKQIYRKASQQDLEKWLEAKRREKGVLLESRKLAHGLQPGMSIGDVEFQGDGKKVAVYYTANGRVDYRDLIRKYENAFRVRIEMNLLV